MEIFVMLNIIVWSLVVELVLEVGVVVIFIEMKKEKFVYVLFIY